MSQVLFYPTQQYKDRYQILAILRKALEAGDVLGRGDDVAHAVWLAAQRTVALWSPRRTRAHARPDDAAAPVTLQAFAGPATAEHGQALSVRGVWV